MTITYANGKKIQAALVVRDENWMRLVLAGQDDVSEFTRVHDAWVSEDCEPVQIEFGPARQVYREYSDDDFVCTHELATKLIHMLLNPEEEEEVETTPVPSPSLHALASALLV